MTPQSRPSSGKRTPAGGGGATTPDVYPTIPPHFSADQHQWMLQSVMEIQKTLAQQTEAMTTMREEIKDLKGSVSTVCGQVQTAQTVTKVVGGIVTAAILILGWIIATFIGPVLDRLLPAP